MKTRVLTDREVPIKIANIRVYRDGKNQLWYSAEDVARKFGLVHLWLKNTEFYHKVHWQTVNKLLKNLGYNVILTQDSFITEDIVMALSKKLHRVDITKLVSNLESQAVFVTDFKHVIVAVKRNNILFNKIKLLMISKVIRDILARISGAVISGVTKAVADIRRAVVPRSRDSPVWWASHL